MLVIMPLRDATVEDLVAIDELLGAAALPLAGVAENVGGLWVVLDEDGVTATAGVEPHGSAGLLRSVVVAPGRRGRGIGRALCGELERRAREAGIDRLYLLTLDSEGFFARLGYAAMSRDEAPAEITGCDEFAKLCPDTAVLMCKRLVGAPIPEIG